MGRYDRRKTGTQDRENTECGQGAGLLTRMRAPTPPQVCEGSASTFMHARNVHRIPNCVRPFDCFTSLAVSCSVKHSVSSVLHRDLDHYKHLGVICFLGTAHSTRFFLLFSFICIFIFICRLIYRLILYLINRTSRHATYDTVIHRLKPLWVAGHSNAEQIWLTSLGVRCAGF